MSDPREYEGDPKKPIDEDDSNNNNGPLGSCHTHLPLVVVVPAVQIDHPGLAGWDSDLFALLWRPYGMLVFARAPRAVSGKMMWFRNRAGQSHRVGPGAPPPRIPRAVSFDTLSVPPPYVLVILLGFIRSEAILLREGII